MKILFWLVVIVVLFVISVKYIERRNIYFPMKGNNINPQAIGLPYEDIHFETSDKKRLHGWFIPSATGKGPTVLFCHGNGGNIGHRLEKILILHDLGLNVFIFDYRGYGTSAGSPSEAGLYRDGDAAYNYLVAKRAVAKDSIILYGESLGGGVAVDLASRVKVKALITEDAFSSTIDIAKVVYPFVPGFMIAEKFDAVRKIKDVSCPKLIIHSVNDEIVPFYLGEKLFDAARPPKDFLEIRGSHNTAFLDSREKFTEGIRSFLKKAGLL